MSLLQRNCANSTCWNRLGLLCLGILLVSGQLAGAQGVKEEAVPRGLKKAAIVEVSGMINLVMPESIKRRCEVAKQKDVDLIIFHINSPGGYLIASQDIAEYILTIDWAHTVAYVPDQAFSGAAMISTACDDIVMHDSAVIGDVGVIRGMQFAEQKVISAVKEMMRSFAKETGRPEALAVAMVDKDYEVFRYTNPQTGELRLLSEFEFNELANPKAWQKGKLVAETRKDRFFTASGEKAKDLGYVEATVRDRDQVLKRYGIVQEPIELPMSWTDHLIWWLNNPWITGLLFVVGLVSLLLEFQMPGIGVFGITSGLCFAIFFWSRVLGGTAGWLEIILFMVGVACIALELFVIPGFGFSGVTGLLLIFVSIVMAGQSGFVPATTQEYDQLTTMLATMVVSGLVFFALALLIGRALPSTPMFGSFILPPPEPTATQEQENAEREARRSELAGLIGQTGQATSALRPAGKALIGEKLYNVTAEGGFIDAGTNIKVVDANEYRVTVRQV